MSRGISFHQLAEIKYYVGINFHEAGVMIFLQKIMVFNKLFQFANKKRRKQWHKLSRAKETRIFREHQVEPVKNFDILLRELRNRQYYLRSNYEKAM